MAAQAFGDVAYLAILEVAMCRWLANYATYLLYLLTLLTYFTYFT